VELHSKNSDRAKLFILHVLAKLVSVHKHEPLFTNYIKVVTELMKLDFTAVNDTIIAEFKNYSEKLVK
jgi:hypothetical protein